MRKDPLFSYLLLKLRDSVGGFKLVWRSSLSIEHRRGDYVADPGKRIRTVAAARTPVPGRRPVARRVGGRPAKPACGDHARRVFTRRERATFHAQAGRARATGPPTFYRSPIRVGPPTTDDAGRTDVRRPAHRCRSGAIARAN